MINQILFFHADWCSQCKLLQKELKDFNYLPITEIDADENDSLCDKYNIKSLPVIILLDESNKEVNRYIGFISKNDLVNLIKNNNYV